MNFADEIRNLMKLNNMSPEEISNLARNVANEIAQEQKKTEKKPVEPATETAKPVEKAKPAEVKKERNNKKVYHFGPHTTLTIKTTPTHEIYTCETRYKRSDDENTSSLYDMLKDPFFFW